jgi:hypothetical protein
VRGGGDDGDPYRSAPAEPRFVCLVCYRSLSVTPGECPRCGVERLPLAEPDVRLEVRAEAEKRLQSRHYGEWFWCYLVAFLALTPIAFFFLGDPIRALAVWVVSSFALGGANVKLYERLNPRSMLRLFADRRRRLALPQGEAPKQLPPRSSDETEDAELARVLALLGARVDGS